MPRTTGLPTTSAGASRNRRGPRCGAPVVKAANTLSAEVLASIRIRLTVCTLIFISGDKRRHESGVHALFQDASFAVIDLGNLATGGAMQQIHHPLAGVNLIRLG